MINSETITLLEQRGSVSPEPRVHYIHHAFEVPAGAARVSVRLRFRKERVCQLFLSLYDPEGFRGCHMQPGASGDIDLALWVGPGDASRGGIPGALPAGRWVAQIDVERTAEAQEYLITAEAELGPAPDPTPAPYPEGYVSRAEAGWYRGELHAHTWESDGRVSADDLVRAAKQLGLDFLALTDHFTTSGFRHLARLQSPELALIRGMELTAHAGHGNLHGIRRWHDVFVDGRQGWGINELAREVREQGGMFCVNHPFGADLGWRYHAFDWGLADMLEVWHAHEGPGNLLAIGLWDEQLRTGRRIVGVAATDSHDPYAPRHRLGTVLTAVHAPELSEAGVLAGLRSGRVYGTRGPHLEIAAAGRGGESPLVAMGGTLPAGQLRLGVEVGPVDRPWRLHILKNGFHHQIVEGTAQDAPRTVSLEDDAAPGSYYRAELHAAPHYSDFPYEKWRGWDTMLAFTNPVFVG